MEYLDVDIKCKNLLVATEVVKAKQMLKNCVKTVAKNSQSAFQLLFKKMTTQAGG